MDPIGHLVSKKAFLREGKLGKSLNFILQLKFGKKRSIINIPRWLAEPLDLKLTFEINARWMQKFLENTPKENLTKFSGF